VRQEIGETLFDLRHERRSVDMLPISFEALAASLKA
jgi:hypothetical protein